MKNLRKVRGAKGAEWLVVQILDLPGGYAGQEVSGAQLPDMPAEGYVPEDYSNVENWLLLLSEQWPEAERQQIGCALGNFVAAADRAKQTLGESLLSKGAPEPVKNLVMNLVLANSGQLAAIRNVSEKFGEDVTPS